MTVGQNIRDYRKSRNLTQKQLGEILGVAQNTVAQWESDYSQPSITQLEKVAEALNVSRISFLPDGWDFLQDYSEEDTEAYKNALNEAKAETDAINYAKQVAYETNHILSSKLKEIPQAYFRNAILNALISLNQEGLWKVLNYSQELSEIKRYKK
ncbi:MAG: helix-turn-helix transcriptional regulator [Oscillospiraceae bacterium]